MTQPKATKAGAREERLLAERRRQDAERRRRVRLLQAGLAAAVVLVVAVVAIVVVSSHKSKVAATATAPPGVTATFGYPVGTATKPVVDVYEDFQCPICEQFEANIGRDIEKLASSGQALVVYHPLTFLDRVDDSSPADVKQSSTRAANAAACAQQQGRFLAFHDDVYRNPPASEGAGFTDAQLLAFGRSAGVPDMSAFATCVRTKAYVPFLGKATNEADQRQVTGTPTFFVAGKMLSFATAKSFADILKIIDDAVAAAK